MSLRVGKDEGFHRVARDRRGLDEAMVCDPLQRGHCGNTGAQLLRTVCTRVGRGPRELYVRQIHAYVMY